MTNSTYKLTVSHVDKNWNNFGLILCIAICNSLLFGCYRQCNFPLSIAAGDLEKDATLRVTMDETLKREFHSPYYHSCSKTQDVLIKDYCGNKKKLKITAKINNRDTVFVVNTLFVSKIYIGHNPQDKYQSFLVYFKYRNNYLGTRHNEIIFED